MRTAAYHDCTASGFGSREVDRIGWWKKEGK